MSKQYVYQSPKKASAGRPARSTWIDESDTVSRRALEEKGWRIVETRDTGSDEPPTVIDENVDLHADLHWMRLVNSLTDVQQQALLDAGFDSAEKLAAATDDTLRDVKGLGPAAVRNIRKAQQAQAE